MTNQSQRCPRRISKMQLVKVTWLDAQLLNPSDGQFRDPNEFVDCRPDPIEIVGWLVAKNENCVVVANELSPETGEVKLVHVIPVGSVVRMVEFRKFGRKKR